MIRDVRSALAAVGARALQTRWLVRAPILLYRGGLGFAFGSRLPILEHVGRGPRRFVVLVVLERVRRHEYIIVSALAGVPCGVATSSPRRLGGPSASSAG